MDARPELRRGGHRSRGRPRANATGDPIPVALTDETEVVVHLWSEPRLRRNTEVCSQPQCRIGRDGTSAIHDCADAVGRDVQIPSQPVCADPQGSHEVFPEDLSRMDWIEPFRHVILYTFSASSASVRRT